MVSLTNKKNTRIVNENGVISLIHHGSTTCEVNLNDRTVTMNLCGWDTLTTRGKIHAFLFKCQIGLSIERLRGDTLIVRRKDGCSWSMPTRTGVVFSTETLAPL